MSITKPIILDETGQTIAEGLMDVAGVLLGNRAQRNLSRIITLNETPLAYGMVVEAVGVPVYLEEADLAQYADYGLAESGWYVFARIVAREGTVVDADTEVDGAAGMRADIGADYIDVAIRFGVTAESQRVVVHWSDYRDVLVFKATDLAIRNLDYRVTFYIYDASEYAHWSYGLTADTVFVAANHYYVMDAEGNYSPAEVVAGEAVPVYFTHSDNYALTTDTTFQDGVAYYTRDGDVYSPAEVTAGEAVTAETYYVLQDSYERATGVFAAGVDYYVLQDSAYVLAEVAAGEVVPAYYVHTLVRFEGMARNITYQLPTVVDCPMEFVLPEVDDDEHGCWIEIRCIHAGEYSMTLIPPSADVKVATEHTQRETAGLNMIDLHYTSINGTKLWRFLNTHSSLPA